jgi:membrane protein CcdC involved in cytochrome C biogenesis
MPRRVVATDAEAGLQLDIIVPVVMSCALLWWVSRGMNWTTRLVVTAVTLAVVICIVLFERSNF